MQTRSNKILLTTAAVIGMIIAGSALTVTVNTIADAQKELGKSSNVQEIGCKVYNIQKTATTQDEIRDNDWEISFAMEYTVDGRKTREGVKTAMVASNTEAAVKAAVEPQCESDWTNAQAKHGTVDTVIIETLATDNAVLSKIYSAVSNNWSNVAVQP